MGPPRRVCRTACRICWQRLPLAVRPEEVAFLLAALLVFLACSLDRFTLGYFGDRNVPPRLVTRHPLFIRRFDDHHRSTRLFPYAKQCFLQFGASPRPSRPGSQARGIHQEINGQRIALVFSILKIAILRAHSLVPATLAEPPTAGKSLVV